VDLPSVSSSNVSTLTNAATAPDDLILLGPKITKSVVTILCGNKQGSAWAINVALTPKQKESGFNSYLVTNHHVIADCTQNTGVTLILSDKTTATRALSNDSLISNTRALSMSQLDSCPLSVVADKIGV